MVYFKMASIRTASGWDYFAPITRVSTRKKTNESAGSAPFRILSTLASALLASTIGNDSVAICF
jgi:hypothetical protein